MCSPALNLLDPRPAGSSGSSLLSDLARTIEAARRSRPHGAERGRFGFAHIERLPHNVGYMELRSFAPADTACDAAAAAMDFLATSDALVMDLRRNTGGDRRMAALLTSYLFDTEPVHLGEIYSSATRHPTDGAVADAVPGRRYLRRDIYLLIGPATSPLAREFARNLEHLRGATVVESREG